MPAAGLLVALPFVALIAGTVALWYVIEGETDDNPRMDRADAERAARQDQDDDATDEREDDWGADAEWGVDDQQR